MASLRQLTGRNSGQIFELQDGTTLIGRNPACCQIVLEHHAVSREHAKLTSAQGEIFVEDLSSRNGVLLNGIMLTPGPSGRSRVHHLDQLDIAGFRFSVNDEGSSSTDVELVSGETSTGMDILSTVAVSTENSDWRLEENPSTKLKAVLRIINDLAHSIDLPDVLPRILDSLFRSFSQAERAFILLRDSPDSALKPAAAKRRDNRTGPIRSSQTIVEEAIQRKVAVLTGNAMLDQRFAESESIHQLKLHSVMCAPLLDFQGEAMGVLQLEVSDPLKSFSRSDLSVLAGVARHISVVIENSRLHDAALRNQRSRLERRFQHLVEGSIQGILVHRELEPLFCNNAWAALHGYSIDEVLELESILHMVSEADREQVRSVATAALRGVKGGHRYEYRGQRKDGTEVWLENLVTVVDWDGDAAVLSTVLDISERKRVESELRIAHAALEERVAERTAQLAKERDLLRTLMDHHPDFVFIKDENGKFITTNASHMDALGVKSLDELKGKTDFDFFPDAAAMEFFREEQEVMRTGTPMVDHEERVEGDFGSDRWMLTTKAPWRDADGKIIGIVGITRDITAVKQAAEAKEHYMSELERSHRDLEQFAAVAAHDLQEPLRAVSVFCELLQRHIADRLDADGEEMIRFIVDGSKRMQVLIEALRTYARITGTRRPRVPIDANKVLDEALANLRAAIQERDVKIVRGKLPTIVADSSQLMQVFQNLVGNAIKFHGDQPLVVTVEAKEMESEWVFTIADNGLGIEPQHFDRIFQIFQRVEKNSDRPGTGIGLAICKKVIEQHGGRVWVESQAGKGSTFYFTLPK